MLKIEIGPTTKRDIEKLKKALQTLYDRLLNRSEPLRKIKRRQISRWARNFDSQGRIYGQWPALSPTWTIPERGRLGFGPGPILVREGKLRSHFVRSNEDGEVTNQAIQWNFRNKPDAYIVTHHLGMPNPIPGRRRIPPRPLWDLDPEDEDAAQKIMDEWVDRIIKRYF